MSSNNGQLSVLHLLMLLTTLSFVGFSNTSYALGLGNLQTLSYLGEPLEAKIIISTGANEDYGPEELRVRQLSAKQASALGIDIAGSLERYRLSLVNESGRLLIALSGTDPVTEPFLNFVVELKWPTGTVYREYTLFLDPPGFQTIVPSNLPAPKVKPAVKPSTKELNPNLTPGSSRYSVQSGDNLFLIAKKLVEGTDNSRSDMMNWLVANNPQAFKNGDMNRLIAGANLRLPQQAQLTQRPNTSRPLPEQKESLVAAPASKPIEEDVQPPANNVNDSNVVGEDRLTIVTPNISKSSISAEELSQAETILALQDTVVATQELAERMKRENAAMLKRLNAMESSDYLNSMERLVELKEQEILALKTKLANSAIQQKEQGNNAAANTDNDTGFKGSTQQWLLMILLIIAILGAAYFYYRWRLMQPIAKELKAKKVSDEQALLNDLESMAVPVKQSGKQTASQVLKSTRQGFTNLGRKARDADRRSEDEIKNSIREKTTKYIPDILGGKYESDYDELDHLISEALYAANNGQFDAAEAMLLAERTEQVRKPSKRENEGAERLESAISYIDQMRQIKQPQDFEE